jgi:integrase
VQTERAAHDVTADLRGAVAPVVSEHHAAITEMTGHGFRSLASTCLNEQGYHPDLIELQLAHAERNKVRAAYNKAQRPPERRKMMQSWSDYLDHLRVAAANSNVVPILARARAPARARTVHI